MRIVVALGGNALIRRGQKMTAGNQRRNARRAAEALVPLVDKHELVITHGNGPQVGLLALRESAFAGEEAYPLDMLGAETEGMIGYLIEQELGNLLPPDRPLATLLTMVEVDPSDPAFDDPTKFIGPLYRRQEANRIAREKGWSVRRDGKAWRRVVASPMPRRIFQIRPIRWLLEKKTVVIAAGGGGIPTIYDKNGKLVGIECVVDKDLCSGVLARELEADILVMATDADAVYLDWGEPKQRGIRAASPGDLDRYEFEAGSMGPKVEAAQTFAREMGGRSVICALADVPAAIGGLKGTTISDRVSRMSFHE